MRFALLLLLLVLSSNAFLPLAPIRHRQQQGGASENALSIADLEEEKAVDTDDTTTKPSTPLHDELTWLEHELNSNNDDDDDEDYVSSSSSSSVVTKESTVSLPDKNNGLLRSLDGSPLTTAYLERVMSHVPRPITSYTCPDDTVFRGLMSDACRIQLHHPSNNNNNYTAFYKRIAFQDLSHCHEKLQTAPHKLQRDIQSYQVVAAWLQSRACAMVCAESGIRIPQCYDAQLEPNRDDPMQSQFSFLLEDLGPQLGWYQQWLFEDERHCHASIATLAQLHAYFWAGSAFHRDQKEASKELTDSIWPSGSYVQPLAQNTATVDQCAIVAREWETKKWKFQEHLEQFSWWDNLGTRLQSVATECGRVAHPFADPDDPIHDAYQSFRTFTHGDPKQANLLFRQQNDEQLQVGLIDFQWTGFGLAATDIAHFMTSSVHADMLVDGGEEQLLQYYYHEQLIPHLVQYGVYETMEEALEQYSYNDVFLEQYEVAVLDICRLMISYTWARFTEPVTRDDPEACERTLNKTSYNKSIPNIVWLLNKCDAILTKRGVV